MTGTSYGIIAPLTHGVTSIVKEGEFDAERWYQVLQAPKTGWSVSFASRSTHTKRLIVKVRTLEHQGPAQRWWSTV